MKRNSFSYSVLLAFGLLLGACSEDNGNYNYTPLDEVVIETIKDIQLEAGAQLQITPTITLNEENAGNFSYSWTIDGEEVSTERNLDIPLPPLSFGGHLCALTMKDMNNGMQYRQQFTLTVSNPFNFGYYFFNRLDDGSSEMTYIPARKEDNSTAEDVMHTTSVDEYVFGNEPSQIYGSFGYNSDYTATRWQLTFLTQEGDNPVIITDNSTFLPTALITSENFINQDQGYEFSPAMTIINQRQEQSFLSNGQFIRYSNGKLYRPARHLQEYYWSYAVPGVSGAAFAWVFDKLSKRIYSIQAYTADNPELGIIADSYAYDDVAEPENNVELTGNLLYAADAYVNNGHQFNAYTGASDGIHIYTYNKATYGARESTFTGETVLPLSEISDNTKLVVGNNGISNGIFYVSGEHTIYSSPTKLPTLSQFCSLPADLGRVEYIGLSALGSRLVVALYDENSPEERKGSVVYIDIASKKITHTFKNIMHHCVAYWGANEASNEGYGLVGDEK